MYSRASSQPSINRLETPKAPLILSGFQGAVTSLVKNVRQMGLMAEIAVNRAINGVILRNEDVCARVIADDAELAQLASTINDEALALLFRYHPIASDLRRTVASMKFSVSLRRIGEHAAKIARLARGINGRPAPPEVEFIEEIHRQVANMLRDGIDAFTSDDIDLACSLKERDRTVDEMNRYTAEKLVQRMAANPAEMTTCVDLLFVSRHLERIGDNVTNMAEEAVYAAAAEDIRHRSRLRVRNYPFRPDLR